MPCWQLAEAPRCRRQTLLAYFGESSQPCGNCDLCQEGVERFDGTIEAQKAMSAIVRTGERFGVEHLIAILTGDLTENVQKYNHDRLPTFGVGKDRRANEWRSIFRQLSAIGLTQQNLMEHGRWTVTDEGWRVLKGEQRSSCARRWRRRPRARARKARGGRRRGRRRRRHDLLAALKACGPSSRRAKGARLRRLLRPYADRARPPIDPTASGHARNSRGRRHQARALRGGVPRDDPKRRALKDAPEPTTPPPA
jgi:ATP-dependent DNA helicase RecQ